MTTNLIKTFGIVFITTAVLSGCKSTPKCSTDDKCKSSIISIPANQATPVNGVMYAIPKQDITLKIVRTKVTKKSLEDKLQTAKDAATKKATALESKSDELKKKKKLITLAVGDKKALAKLNLEASILELEETVLKKEKADADKKRLKAQQDLDKFSSQGEHFKDDITMSAGKPYPDADNLLVAQLNTNYVTSETIELKTTAAGLLSGGTGKSEGQVDQIIVSAISAIKSVKVKTPPLVKIFSVNPMQTAQKKSCAVNPKEETFEFKINFDDDNYADNLKSALDKTSLCYYEFDLVTQITKSKLTSDTESKNDSGQEQISNAIDGLVYPRKRQLQFNVYNVLSNDDKSFVKSLYTDYIDSSRLAYISLDKGRFATNEYEFEFTDGLLTRYKSTKPNEIVEALSLIPEAAKAIISVPGEILQLKIDYSSKEAAYYDAQRLVLEAKEAYEKQESEETSSDNASE